MSDWQHLPALRVVSTAATSVVAASLTTLAMPVAADDAPSVVVSAARSAQALTDAIPHTTVLTRVDIERSQAVDLVALLAFEAGLQLSANGGRGTASSLFVRGAAQRQVLVIVDGMPLARQDATGQVGIEHLMLDQIERIEIVRGNVSSLYGSGAIGGVIQVFTRKGGPSQASLVGEAGARGTARLSGQASGTSGRTQWSFGVSGEGERGRSVVDTTQVPEANPDRDGYRNISASFNLSHAVADGQTLGLGLFHTEGRLDYDSFFATPADIQKSRNRKDLLRLTSDNRISERWTSQLMLSTQRDDARNEETGDFGFIGRWRTTVDTLNWTNALKVDERTRLNLGIEQQRQRIDADDGFGGQYATSRTTSAGFVGVLTHFGAHELSVDLRRDRVGGVGSRSSASVGWSFALAPSWKSFARVANAFGSPPLGYLYAPFFGNPALRPERSGSAELGLQWSGTDQRLRGTLFRARVTDEIDFDLRTFVFANVARTRNEGLELSWAGRIGATDVRSSLTSQRPVDDITGDARLRRSKRLASITASHDLGQGWRIGVAARHAGARPEVGNTRLAAYTVADLSAQWDFKPDAQWFVRVENVGDARYQTAFGYDQAPRGLFTGLRWRLAL